MDFRKRLAITIGIYLGIILILSVVLLFLGSDIVKRADEIKRLQGDLGFRLRATETLALLRQDYEQAQLYIPALENILPTRDQLVNFPKDLNALARNKQVSLNISLKEEKSHTETELGSINLAMTAQGPLDGLVDFLIAIENSKYFVKLNELDFTRQDSDFKALITGQVFSF